MQHIKKIRPFYKLFSIVFIASTISLAALPGSVYSQDNDASVVLVHLMFADKKWSLGPDKVRILPCKAPREFIDGTERDPLIKVLGPDEKVVYQRKMRNPRLILIEDPKEKPRLLDKVSFNLRFALADGMERFEFWYAPLEQKEPSVRVDLRDAVKKYWDEGGPRQKAPCQQPKYVPDQLKQ